MTARTALTELEGCVLGFVAQEQPCTAYTVRKRLSTSLSSYWSNSAGSIYPLLERLAERKWLLVSEEAFGTRVRKSYRISAAGRRRLRRWLSAPVSRPAAAHTYDPLRSMLFFFELIDAKTRREFLQDAKDETEQNIRAHRQQLEELRAERTPYQILGREAAIGELENRLKWIRKAMELG